MVSSMTRCHGSLPTFVSESKETLPILKSYKTLLPGLDDKKWSFYEQYFTVNQTMITADRKSFEWEPHVMKHKIIETLQGNPMNEVTITKVGHSSTVMSEFFDMLASFLISPTDL